MPIEKNIATAEAATSSLGRPKDKQVDALADDNSELNPDQAANPDNLRLPHEHDESPKAGRDVDTSSSPLPRQVVEQAASDITRGLRDSERRGIPSDIPAPGPDPENSQGGEVPAAGIDRKSTASRTEQMKKAPDEE